MQIVLTLLIAGMLGTWVYNLKQEVQDLEDRVTRNPHKEMTRTRPQAIAELKIRQRRDEEQVWMLE